MNTHDGRWHDSMYNNRALVPDHASHLSRWAEESAQVQRSQHRVLDVHYASRPEETLDIFPAEHDDVPVLFFIHGGYWRSLDKRDHSFIAPAFTRRDVCVVVPNYTLAPAITVPGIAMQMVAALAWTFNNIQRYGGDPNRITVAGHSAGGHLAALLLCCHWPAYRPDLPPTLVRNALSISGLFDLEPIRLAPFVQESLRLTPAQVQQASPALLPAPTHAPLYSVVGGAESEEFLRQNLLIREAWGPAAVPVCKALPGFNHFSVLQPLAQPGSELHGLAMELLFA